MKKEILLQLSKEFWDYYDQLYTKILDNLPETSKSPHTHKLPGNTQIQKLIHRETARIHQEEVKTLSEWFRLSQWGKQQDQFTGKFYKHLTWIFTNSFSNASPKKTNDQKPKKLKRREHFLIHSVRPALPWYPKHHHKRKLQTYSICHKYRGRHLVE